VEESKQVAKKTTAPKETSNEKKNVKIIRDRLKIIPLGGLEEVGKNMTVFEYGNEMILVDCGVAFPEDDMLGVDLVIPDFSYLTKNKEKLQGMIITHGHEDHIGSVPYVLKEINTPIYATRLTLGLIVFCEIYIEQFLFHILNCIFFHAIRFKVTIFHIFYIFA
jgi:ribonuclease J